MRLCGQRTPQPEFPSASDEGCDRVLLRHIPHIITEDLHAFT